MQTTTLIYIFFTRIYINFITRSVTMAAMYLDRIMSDTFRLRSYFVVAIINNLLRTSVQTCLYITLNFVHHLFFYRWLYLIIGRQYRMEKCSKIINYNQVYYYLNSCYTKGRYYYSFNGQVSGYNIMLLKQVLSITYYNITA